MEAPESQNSRDARIEKLWLQLDPQKKGAIDLDDLQRGLRRIDHRMLVLLPQQQIPQLTSDSPAECDEHIEGSCQVYGQER